MDSTATGCLVDVGVLRRAVCIADQRCARGSMFLGPLAEAAHARPVRQQWQPNTLLPAKLLPRPTRPSPHWCLHWVGCGAAQAPDTQPGGALLHGECERTVALLTPLQALCLPACT